MTEIIKDVVVRLGVAELSANDKSRLKMKGNHRQVQIPILVGVEDSRLNQWVNLYLLRKASEGRKDLLPSVKAFKTWIDWLQSRNINPFESTLTKFDSPTYAFRHHLLERINSEKTLASSTANSYILTVKNFYDMLGGEGVIDTRDFFKKKISIVDGFRKVQSSDLSIRVSRAGSDTLSPLSQETQNRLLVLIEKESYELRLIVKLMIMCGLRLSEVLSLTSSLFVEELLHNNGGNAILGIMIGPKQGVRTKFSKERELFLPSFLLNEILDYKVSKSYLTRKSKFDAKKIAERQPLFLSRGGGYFTKSAFYSSWYRLKFRYKLTFSEDFDHQPHDLRATFATGLLSASLKLEPDNQEACLDFVRHFMGHKDNNTTQKYIKFAHRKSLANSVAKVIDDFVSQGIIKWK